MTGRQTNTNRFFSVLLEVEIFTSSSKDAASNSYCGSCYVKNCPGYPKGKTILATIPYGARTHLDASRGGIVTYRPDDTFLGISSYNQGNTRFIVQILILYK